MHKFKKLERIVDDYARAYNYDYDAKSIKSYDIDKKNIIFKINNTSSESFIEIASLGYNILRELDIEGFLEMPQREETKILDYLEVIWTKGNDYNYFLDDNFLGQIIIEDNSTVLKLYTPSLLEYIDNDKEELEVNIIAKNSEELFKGQIIMQDLRLSGVITDLNKEGAKINIKLKSEKLAKGLVTIEDALIKEEEDIPEDEVLEYILGII